jgi:hypothetical protein
VLSVKQILCMRCAWCRLLHDCQLCLGFKCTLNSFVKLGRRRLLCLIVPNEVPVRRVAVDQVELVGIFALSDLMDIPRARTIL